MPGPQQGDLTPRGGHIVALVQQLPEAGSLHSPVVTHFLFGPGIRKTVRQLHGNGWARPPGP